MFKCYEKPCQNEVPGPDQYCLDHQKQHYPEAEAGSGIKDVQAKLLAKAHSPSVPTIIPNAAGTQLFDLSFEELKVKEQRADEFLKANKILQKEDPKRWDRLMARYKRIVYWLNMKTLTE